jgi:hypothetical protein
LKNSLVQGCLFTLYPFSSPEQKYFTHFLGLQLRGVSEPGNVDNKIEIFEKKQKKSSDKIGGTS